MLETFSACIDIFDGDSTAMLIFFTIFQYSVSRRTNGATLLTSGIEGVPDALRRTVSILSVADYLGLPYETTRRHVLKLVDRGYCVRKGKREFLIPSAILSRQEFVDLSQYTFDLTQTYIKKVRPYLAV